MDLGSRAQQEIGERRMQRVARDEVRGGREQHDVAIGHVGRQIEHAVRKHELRQIREPARVGIGAREADQPDRWLRGQLLDGRRFGGSDHEYGIEQPRLQLLDRGLAVQREQLCRGLVRPGCAEQRQRERVRSAFGAPDRETASLQLAHVVDGVSPVEDPERHVRKAAERNDLPSARAGVGPALDERDIHTIG